MPASSRPSRASQATGAPNAPAARRARTADVRSALVDAAWWVLEHDGVAGLTVRAVAARAGVAPMGVYNHLRDKDGLLTAVLTRAFDEFTAAIAHRDDLPPTEALVAQGRAYRDFALAHPVPYSLMFGSSRIVVGEGDDPGVVGLLQAGERAFGQLVTGIHAGQLAGIVRDGDPEQIAWTVWSAVHGAVSLESATGREPRDAGEVYEQVLLMVVRGIAPDAR